MKKVLVVLLVLCVGAGAFAQEITPYGSLRLDLGGHLSNDGTDNTGAYEFNANNSGTGLGLNFTGDNFEGNINWSPGDDGMITGYGQVTLADILKLKVGQGWLPSAFWSPLAFFGNSNWSTGATAYIKAPYFQLGAYGAYLGVGAPANMDTDGQSPVFYAGYDFAPESGAFTVGISFTGQSVNATAGSPAGFPLLVSLHGRVSPTETIHILGNVGFYKAPALSVAGGYANGSPIANHVGEASGDKGLVLEGFIGASIGISDAFGIDIVFGGEGDLASKDDFGNFSLITAGLDAQIKLNDNFKLIPGVIFYMPLGTDPQSYLTGTPEKVKGFRLSYGVSIGYSF